MGLDPAETDREIRRQARLISLFEDVTRANAWAATAEDAIQACLTAVCTHFHWPVGHVYMVNEVDPDELLPSELWYLADTEQFEEFRRVTESTPLKRGSGLPGVVLEARSPVWISDVSTHDNFPRAKLCSKLTLKGAFGVPILAGSKMLGVLEFFCERAEDADRSLMRIVGQVAALLGDTLERQRAHEIIRESEARFRALAGTAVDAIITADSTGVVTYFNRAAQLMFGYRADEVIGNRISMLMPERYREAHEAGLKRVTETGETKVIGTVVELEGQRKDGSEFPLALSLGTWEYSGQRFFTSIIRDTSRQKEMEDRLLQSQKMDAVGRLAGGIAHDFNNLLSVVINAGAFLTESVNELGTDEEVRPLIADINEIREAADRGARLVRQLLTFAGRGATHPEPVDLNMIVSDIEELLHRTLGEDVELALDLAPALGSVAVDVGQIEQVLINLAVNARDAMPHGGTLTIGTSPVMANGGLTRTHPGMKQGPYSVITVTDSGSGMDQTVMEHIFEPFFSTKPRDRGTGMGLATVYAIVTGAGGQISVYSEPRLGTTFRIYLPVTGEAPIPDTDADEEPIDIPRSGTILLVEDEDPVRRTVERMLKDSGYTVLAASSGREAIEMFDAAEGPIELVVTDMIMPYMSGPDVVDALIGRSPGLKAVFMSGYTDDLMADRGMLAEESVFLGKPFEKNQLLAAIDAASRATKTEVTQTQMKVLIVDDDIPMTEVLHTLLDREFVVVGNAYNGADALRLARTETPDCVILDQRMPVTQGNEVAVLLRDLLPGVKIIAFSAVLTEKPEWADEFVPKERIVDLGAVLTGLTSSS